LKLTTIISAWGDTLCLLPHCIENHSTFADSVIVVWSETSNYGVKDPRMKEFVYKHTYSNVIFHQLEPQRGRLPAVNERAKRNAGIDVARTHGFSHFIIADADEFYDARLVEWEKEKFNQLTIYGLVCGLRVYVRHPTLYTTDHTLVPFIHKLTPKIKCVENRYYPFAYDNGGARIDPTRRFNISEGVVRSDIQMHHMSYVRSDINMKIANSTANLDKMRERIEYDMENAKDGGQSKIYNSNFVKCENKFNIPIWT
jgi:hypothetical protein